MYKLLVLFLFCANFAYGQVCIEKEINPVNPAPCSIEGASQLYDGWLIQVGVYRHFITPKPGIMTYAFIDEQGPFYVYYIDKNFTEVEARVFTETYRQAGYCDAYPVKNPVPLKISRSVNLN